MLQVLANAISAEAAELQQTADRLKDAEGSAEDIGQYQQRAQALRDVYNAVNRAIVRSQEAGSQTPDPASASA